jgi:hypothetical protein
VDLAFCAAVADASRAASYLTVAKRQTFIMIGLDDFCFGEISLLFLLIFRQLKSVMEIYTESKLMQNTVLNINFRKNRQILEGIDDY